MKPFPWRELQNSYVVGVDEVGRGCLAGRVYAAAVILNPELDTDEFVDSKKLSSLRREKIAADIQQNHKYSIGFAEVHEIESMNILNASLLAMERAVRGLGFKNEDLEAIHLLVDGNQPIKGLRNLKQTLLVKGDQRAQPIAAASIVAKVARDRELNDYAKKYPQYGFEKHKGYGTSEHRAAIEIHGPCEIHRKTFAGVKEFVSRPSSESGASERV